MSRFYLFRFFGVLLAGTLLFTTAQAQNRGITSLKDLRAARSEMAAKARPLIANNDGCDALYFPREKEPTVQNFLDYRTAMLTGTQVATIAYCTISSGFGLFTHDTKTGELLTRQGIDFKIRPEAKNIGSSGKFMFRPR